jgi:hypothetical protein
MRRNERRAVVIAALGLALALPAGALAVKVAGNKYPAQVSVGGKQLKLVGAGLREKWFFDVYTMGVYSESGGCGAAAQINADEVKYLRIDMLRDVEAAKMASTLKEAFDNNTPAGAPAKLKQQVRKFLGYFKTECTAGTKLEFTYIPGTGTTLKQNGKRLGPPLDGKAFADVLWSCYFSTKTCCPDLKQQILSHCR